MVMMGHSIMQTINLSMYIKLIFNDGVLYHGIIEIYHIKGIIRLDN